jgi:uncharacterized protein YbjT (DUF2867 family)
MRAAVVGGTGTFGALAAAELRRRGHEVVVLSRRPGNGTGAADHRRVDLSTGEGLPGALDGIDIVVDSANATRPGRAMREVLVGGTRRLLDAGAQAGVRHHALVSIVGIDRVPVSYYKVKLEQEQALASAKLPASILRATQFHQLVDKLFSVASRFGALPTGAIRLQPVDPAEVAAVLAAALEQGPWPGRIEIAGPEVMSLTDLAGVWRAARGIRRLLVPVPALGKAGHALRDGALTAPDGPRGSIDFRDWLSRSG